MDLQAIIDAAEQLAHQSDAGAAGRVFVVYVGANDSGLYIHRVSYGTHRLTAADNFRRCLMEAVDKLWPECSKQTRAWLQVAADFITRSPIAAMLGGGKKEREDNGQESDEGK